MSDLMAEAVAQARAFLNTHGLDANPNWLHFCHQWEKPTPPKPVDFISWINSLTADPQETAAEFARRIADTCPCNEETTP